MRVLSRKTAVSVAAAATVFLAVPIPLVLSWRSQPAFYSAALAADRQLQVQGSNALLEQASALVNNAGRQGRWQALFTDQQINGWLAIDLPENHRHLLPPALACPRVLLDRGQVTVACRHGSGALSTVMILNLEPYLSGPNELAIRIRGAHAGWFPLPLQPVLDQLSQGAVEAGLSLRWEQADGDPIAVIRLAPRRRDGHLLSLETLEIHAGELYVAGTTRSGSWPAEERSPEKDPRGRVLQAKLRSGSIDR